MNKSHCWTLKYWCHLGSQEWLVRGWAQLKIEKGVDLRMLSAFWVG